VYAPAEEPDDEEPEEPSENAGKLLITGNSYYNSAIRQTPITNDNLVAKFASTQLFTREDLPIGTVIEIASGFQYRPEGWVGTTLNTSSTRPLNVTTSKVVIDEAWWGDYTVRGFNISMTNGGLYEDNKEAFLNALKITLPGKTIDLDVQGPGYYNSTTATWYEPITDDQYAPSYAYTKKLTKEDLPTGSVITIASGFRYRPDGWKDGGKNTNRLDFVTTTVTVDEAWWGEFTEKAFNISSTTGLKYEGNEEAFKSAITISTPAITLTPVEVTA
jgi:hypothetical protein